MSYEQQHPNQQGSSVNGGPTAAVPEAYRVMKTVEAPTPQYSETAPVVVQAPPPPFAQHPAMYGAVPAPAYSAYPIVPNGQAPVVGAQDVKVPEDTMMVLQTNVFDLLFFWLGCGFAFHFMYLGISLFLLLSVVGLPLVPSVMRLVRFTMQPYTNRLIRYDVSFGSSAGLMIGNSIWAFLFGTFFALAHLCMAAVYCATIIGIPFGIVHFRLAHLVLTPLRASGQVREYAHVQNIV
eukprot:Unigene4953_Nuclearia_a/m.15153 Unigene4953_Nuclearia_a/g.15153  ORF Unigene4953_Nuclearia_a/g.15153 Unigene4953_Nuclearia_a/m.15153 type:complete len:236 (+) Unigene4953_Nuclearia_a:133-840(+)